MGKCLSCFKPQQVSTICMNETSNTLKSKTDLSSIVLYGDGCGQKCSQSNQCHQQFTRSNASSHLNAMNDLYCRDNDVMQATVANYNDSTSLDTEIRAIIDDTNNRPSKSRSKQHFSPFFSGKPTTAIKEYDSNVESKLNALFDKYRDFDEKDLMLMEGVEKLCNDLNLQPDDFKILILAWKFNAEQMCQFTRLEFVSGCKDMKVENISQIRDKLSELVNALKRDQQQFKNLYRFTFKFGLDRTVGERILPKDVALCLWKLVFTLHKPPILDRWLNFLRSDDAHIRGIPRDTWNMFLNFCETVGNDLSSYDDAEAWPSIFDDFVEYEKNRP